MWPVVINQLKSFHFGLSPLIHLVELVFSLTCAVYIAYQPQSWYPIFVLQHATSKQTRSWEGEGFFFCLMLHPWESAMAQCEQKHWCQRKSLDTVSSLRPGWVLGDFQGHGSCARCGTSLHCAVCLLPLKAAASSPWKHEQNVTFPSLPGQRQPTVSWGALPAGNVLMSSQQPRKAVGEFSSWKYGTRGREEATGNGLIRVAVWSKDSPKMLVIFQISGENFVALFLEIAMLFETFCRTGEIF